MFSFEYPVFGKLIILTENIFNRKLNFRETGDEAGIICFCIIDTNDIVWGHMKYYICCKIGGIKEFQLCLIHDTIPYRRVHADISNNGRGSTSASSPGEEYRLPRNQDLQE